MAKKRKLNFDGGTPPKKGENNGQSPKKSSSSAQPFIEKNSHSDGRGKLQMK